MTYITLLLIALIVVQWAICRQIRKARDEYLGWFEHQRDENVDVWRRYHHTKKLLDQAEASLIDAMSKPRARR